MRVGFDNNYLSIEKLGRNGVDRRWRIEAVVGHAGWHSAMVHDDVRVASPDELAQRMADFAAHKVQQFEVLLMESGWLRLKRSPNGRVVVRYRVAHLNVGAAMEGTIALSREDAEKLCPQIGGLL